MGGGVTRQSIERWEAGRTSPQPAPFAAVVAVIAARLEGVDASDLAHWIRTGETPEARPVSRKPKDIDTEQQAEEWLDSLGEGARRDFEG